MRGSGPLSRQQRDHNRVHPVCGSASRSATGITGATFERPLSMGGPRVFMYETHSAWYANYHLWIAVGFAFAMASLLTGLLARRS